MAIANAFFLSAVFLNLLGLVSSQTAAPQKTPGVIQDQMRPALVVQRGHSWNTAQVTFSPDDKLALTAGNEGGVNLWDVESGALIRTFDTKGLTAAFSPDGRYFLTGGSSTILWNVATLKEVRRFLPGKNATRSLAFSPDGKLVLIASGAHAHLCHVETGECEQETFKVHEREDSGSLKTKTLAFSGNGKYFLTSGRHPVLWNLQTRTQVREFKVNEELGKFGGDTEAVAVAFSPDSNFVLVAAGRNAILYETETGQEIRSYNFSHKKFEFVEYADFSRDGKMILIGSYKLLTVIDFATSREVFSTGETMAAHGESCFSSTGEYVLSGNTIWKTKTGEVYKHFVAYSDKVWKHKISPDGKYLLTLIGVEFFVLWNLETGQELKRFPMCNYGNKQQSVLSSYCDITFAPKNKLLLIDAGGRVLQIDPATEKPVSLPFNQTDPVDLVVVSPNERYAVLGRKIQNLATGTNIFDFGNEIKVSHAVFSPDEKRVLFVIEPVTLKSPQIDGCTYSNSRKIILWNLEKKQEEQSFKCVPFVGSIDFSNDGKNFVVGQFDDISEKGQYIFLEQYEVETGAVRRLEGHSATVYSSLYSPMKSEYIASASLDGTALLWDSLTGKRIREFRGHEFYVTSVAFIHNGRYLVTSSTDNTTRIWDTATGQELCRLISFKNGDWVAATPDGRFDTNNLEEIKGLHWIFPDEPLRPLSLEIFMRDYYQPRLLRRLLGCHKQNNCDKEFEPLPPLVELNRNQPQIESITVLPHTNNPELADVKVEVLSAAGQCLKDNLRKPCESGVYDLRLYRDGQLVRQLPQAQAKSFNRGLTQQSREAQRDEWRRESLVKTIDDQAVTVAGGKREVVFKGIRLPKRAGISQVEFTAYAFNEDRVKSATSKPAVYKLPEPRSSSIRRRAYVITVGVDAASVSNWDLLFAANSARDIEKLLTEKLKSEYEILSVPLISEVTDAGRSILATKHNIQTVLEILSGKAVPDQQKRKLPGYIREKLQPAVPDDLVVLYIASHGYAAPKGGFYIIPSDLGENAADVSGTLLSRCLTGNEQSASCEKTQSFLQRSISSDELAQWLQAVDAGEMTLILDSCHSGAVTGPNFKPGPMGDRSFGQLSYDKAMRVLAATQAENAAWGTAALKDRSLLTQVLTKSNSNDGVLDMELWLGAAERAVAELSEQQLLLGKQVQEPVFFNFKRRSRAR